MLNRLEYLYVCQVYCLLRKDFFYLAHKHIIIIIIII